MNHNRFVRQQRERRRFRVRKGIKGTTERPRLSVKRSHKHMYCQVIDDVTGRTLVSASTIDKDIRGTLKQTGNKDAATAVGKALAARVTAAGITALCFDRGAYKYHGRIASIADAIREAGISV